MVNRGDIWIANPDQKAGSEDRKLRAWVIVSPQAMHADLRNVIIAPISEGDNPSPYRIPIAHEGKAGLILLDQLRAVDKSRLVRKSGAVPDTTLVQALGALQVMFAHA